MNRTELNVSLKFQYPQKIGKFDVKYVRDLTVGYDNEQPGNKPVSFTLLLLSAFYIRLILSPLFHPCWSM